MTGFVFYDFETTGDRLRLIRPSSLRLFTDENFVEIERVNIKPSLPYILPAPKALEVTGVNPNDTLSSDHFSAFEFANVTASN